MTDPTTDGPTTSSSTTAGEPTAEGLRDRLDDVTADSPALRAEIRETQALISAARQRGLIESGVRRLDTDDAAEAFVGSVIFAVPLLVEDGVFDIATHLIGVAVYGIPLFLIANTLFVVFMTYALLEWTGRDKTETHHIFGTIPTRVVMILVVSFVAAAILMTTWGRVPGWQQPREALARVNVLWTVGAIGAALGDILSTDTVSPAAVLRDSDDPTPAEEPTPTETEGLSDGELLTSIHEQFDELESVLETDADRREIRHLQTRAQQAALEDGFGDQIDKYTSRDIAEAFVGSVFFSIPFLVEDGVFDVADYFLSFRIGRFPVFFLLNTAVVLLLVAVLVYRTGPQTVRVSRPILGFIPRRLVGITAVAFLTAAALMTMWGRVEHWGDPVVAIARISVVWTIASFGAALGDILPGESSGNDINDDLADLTDFADRGDPPDENDPGG